MSAFPAALRHGPLLPVCDGVHAVRGQFRMGPGVLIPRTMTIVAADDGLVVLNAIRLDAAGEAALAALGRVAHLVKLADAHGIDEPYYVDRFSPQVWTLPGARLGGVPAGRTLGPDGPVAGGVVIDLTCPKGGREASYWIPHGGGTLVTCDAVQHHVDGELASWLARRISPLLGFSGGVIVPRMWRKVHGVDGAAVREVLAGLTARPFANLVTGHGPPVIGGADAAVRDAIARVS